MPKFKDERLTALIIIVIVVANMILTLAGHETLVSRIDLAAQTAAQKVSAECVQAVQAEVAPR
jgi:hypothetical protein